MRYVLILLTIFIVGCEYHVTPAVVAHVNQTCEWEEFRITHFTHVPYEKNGMTVLSYETAYTIEIICKNGNKVVTKLSYKEEM